MSPLGLGPRYHSKILEGTMFDWRTHGPYLLVRVPVRPEHDRVQSCAIALRSPASERLHEVHPNLPPPLEHNRGSVEDANRGRAAEHTVSDPRARNPEPWIDRAHPCQSHHPQSSPVCPGRRSRICRPHAHSCRRPALRRPSGSCSSRCSGRRRTSLRRRSSAKSGPACPARSSRSRSALPNGEGASRRQGG